MGRPPEIASIGGIVLHASSGSNPLVGRGPGIGEKAIVDRGVVLLQCRAVPDGAFVRPLNVGDHIEGFAIVYLTHDHPRDLGRMWYTQPNIELITRRRRPIGDVPGGSVVEGFVPNRHTTVLSDAEPRFLAESRSPDRGLLGVRNKKSWMTPSQRRGTSLNSSRDRDRFPASGTN